MAMDCIGSSGCCFDAVTDQTGPSVGFRQSGEWRFGPGSMKKSHTGRTISSAGTTDETKSHQFLNPSRSQA